MVNKMAMLAEPRRKTKYSVDPRGTSWSKDDSKFGQKLMEKMGWSKGKGLGVKEDGNKDHVSVLHKTDKKGIGCAKAGYTDDWIAHQDDFSALLTSLNQDHGTGSASKSGEGSKDGDTTKVISLEQTSKTSKGRVHYQKFTKGKDLSLKSENDLDCVFGKRRSRPATHTPQSQSEASSDASDADENGAGLKTVTSTDSVQDYFARKMAEKKKRLQAGNTIMESEQAVRVNQARELGDEPTNDADDISDGSTDRKKKNKKSKKAKKRKVEEEYLDLDGSVDGMLNSKDAEDVNANKKRKVEDMGESNVHQKKRVSFMIGEDEVAEDTVTNINDISNIQDGKKLKKDKKKDKKKETSQGSDIKGNSNDNLLEESQVIEEGEQLVETSSKKKKKKKSKKKTDENSVLVDGVEPNKPAVANGNQNDNVNVKSSNDKLNKKSPKKQRIRKKKAKDSTVGGRSFRKDQNNSGNVKGSNKKFNGKKSPKKQQIKKKKSNVPTGDLCHFRGANLNEVKGYEGYEVGSPVKKMSSPVKKMSSPVKKKK